MCSAAGTSFVPLEPSFLLVLPRFSHLQSAFPLWFLPFMVMLLCKRSVFRQRHFRQVGIFLWVKTIAAVLMRSPFESLKPFTKLVKSNFTPQKEKRIWYFSYPGIPPTPKLSCPLHIAFRSLAVAEGFMQIAQLFSVLVKITLLYF